MLLGMAEKACLLNFITVKMFRSSAGNDGGSRRTSVAAGAGYLARSSGKWRFEVEVVEAKGFASVGVAGTNFSEQYVGADEASWPARFRQAPDIT